MSGAVVFLGVMAGCIFERGAGTVSPQVAAEFVYDFSLMYDFMVHSQK